MTTTPLDPDMQPAGFDSMTREMRITLWILRSDVFIALRRRSPLAVQVLLCLWAHGNGIGSRCFPSLARLAALAKTSTSSVSLAIKLLELGGWIVVERQRYTTLQGEPRQHNRYLLTLPPELQALHAEATAWLARPSSGTDAPPVQGSLLQHGDLWGEKGKGRRRSRIVRVPIGVLNSPAWDALWRTDAVAAHLWLLLQAYGPSGEELSLRRLAGEVGVRASVLTAALRELRSRKMIERDGTTVASTGTVASTSTVASTDTDTSEQTATAAREARPRHRRPNRYRTVAPELHRTLEIGAHPEARRGRTRAAAAACPRTGRWQAQGKERPRRTLTAPVVRPRTAPVRPPRTTPSPVAPAASYFQHDLVAGIPHHKGFDPRWCRKHGALSPLLEGADLRYGGVMACACQWSPLDDKKPAEGRPQSYRPLG